MLQFRCPPEQELLIVNPSETDIEGYPWYQRYQPVSYQIESRSGSRKEFASMVETCRDAGVDIYVDAVINHMSGVVPEGEEKEGSAGSSFSYYQYHDYSYDDFHHCGTEFDDITNYGSRFGRFQNCELVNLADPQDRSTLTYKIRYQVISLTLCQWVLLDFVSMQQKHMSADDILSIIAQTTSKAGSKPYVFQEVIDQGGEPITSREYSRDNNDVTEFKYSVRIGDTFSTGKLDWFNNNVAFGEGWGFIPSHTAVVFTDNHDNQRGHGGGGMCLTHKEPDLYKLSNIFMLAWPYGYPKVMSSYQFTHWQTLPVFREDELSRFTGSVH